MFCFEKDLKLKFYHLMIDLDQHDGSYLAICKHFLAIYNTQVIKDDPLKLKEVRSILTFQLCSYTELVITFKKESGTLFV